MDERLFVVFNPHSGRGRGARLVAPVLASLGPSVDHALSAGPGDEARLAREALERGFRRIVAVGGDGTWSNVGNAILASGKPASLALIAGGTGCDLAKSLGIPAQDVLAAARVARQGRVRAIDVGRIEDRHFLNVAGFGLDIAVIEHSWRVRWFGGPLLYAYCALRQLLSYPGFRVEAAEDDAPALPREPLMMIVANARMFGGTFAIAPQADLEDGRLDCVTFGNVTPLRRLPLMLRIVRGTHLGATGVSHSRVASLRLRFEAPPAYETDGEWNQARSRELTITSVPRALRVLVPAEA